MAAADVLSDASQSVSRRFNLRELGGREFRFRNWADGRGMIKSAVPGLRRRENPTMEKSYNFISLDEGPSSSPAPYEAE